jgi:hypothetical protein
MWSSVVLGDHKLRTQLLAFGSPPPSFRREDSSLVVPHEWYVPLYCCNADAQCFLSSTSATL